MENINQPKLKTKQTPHTFKICSKGHLSPHPHPRSLLWGLKSSLYQHRVSKSLRSYTSLLAKITALSLVFSGVLVSVLLLLLQWPGFVCLPISGEQHVPWPQIFTGTGCVKSRLHAVSLCVSNHLPVLPWASLRQRYTVMLAQEHGGRTEVKRKATHQGERRPQTLSKLFPFVPC